MTSEQKKILGMVVLDPDDWMANAVEVLGKEKANEALEAKVAKYREQYIILSASKDYLTRSAKEVVDQKRISDLVEAQKAQPNKYDSIIADATKAKDIDQLKTSVVKLIETLRG